MNGSQSQEDQVTSSIPQGSILAPILFVIYISDLPNQVESKVRIFADDTKLFTQSYEQRAREILQTDFDKLHQWSMAWLLKFYPEKCCTLKLCHPTSNQTCHMLDENPINNRHALATVEVEKNLGVVVDSKLAFKDQISQSTPKANKTLGVILWFFDQLAKHTFIQLYKARVRPILEYGHSVWQPALKTLN